MDLKALETKISEHAYLQALEQGRIQPDLLTLTGQQNHIISSDLRRIGLILSRQGMLPSRRFLMNVLQVEAAALALGCDAELRCTLVPSVSCRLLLSELLAQRVSPCAIR